LAQVDLQALQAPNQQINRISAKKLCAALPIYQCTHFSSFVIDEAFIRRNSAKTSLV
jgi:hypothetical protein